MTTPTPPNGDDTNPYAPTTPGVPSAQGEAAGADPQYPYGVGQPGAQQPGVQQPGAQQPGVQHPGAQPAWQVTMPSTLPQGQAPTVPGAPEPFYKRTWFLLVALIGAVVLFAAGIAVVAMSLFRGVADSAAGYDPVDPGPSTSADPWDDGSDPFADPFGNDDGSDEGDDGYMDGHDATADPMPTIVAEGTIGQPVTEDGVEYTVTKVEVVDTIEGPQEFDRATPSGKFVVVDLQVRNVDSDYGAYVFADELQLVHDGDQARVAGSPDADYTFWRLDQGFQGGIQKGESTTGKVAFDVPADQADAATWSLVIPSTDEWGEGILIHLKG